MGSPKPIRKMHPSSDPAAASPQRHLAVESRQKIQNSGLPLQSRRARRVLKSRAALMLAQRAPGETAFGCVHQPTSMAAGLATRELADDRTFAGEIVRNPRTKAVAGRVRPRDPSRQQG